MRQILKIGIPIALQDSFIQIAFIVITIIANRRGLTAAAAVGIVEKIISFLFLVPSSMLSTVSALGAQNIGAGKKKRAEQTMWCAVMIAVGFGLIVAVTMQFISVPVVSLFTTDSEVARLGGQYIRGYIWDCIFAGIHFTFSGYFCACRTGRNFPSLHNIICHRARPHPGRLSDLALVPGHPLPDGNCNGVRLADFRCDLPFRVPVSEAEGIVKSRRFFHGRQTAF